MYQIGSGNGIRLPDKLVSVARPPSSKSLVREDYMRLEKNNFLLKRGE